MLIFAFQSFSRFKHVHRVSRLFHFQINKLQRCLAMSSSRSKLPFQLTCSLRFSSLSKTSLHFREHFGNKASGRICFPLRRTSKSRFFKSFVETCRQNYSRFDSNFFCIFRAGSRVNVLVFNCCRNSSSRHY